MPIGDKSFKEYYDEQYTGRLQQYTARLSSGNATPASLLTEVIQYIKDNIDPEHLQDLEKSLKEEKSDEPRVNLVNTIETLEKLSHRISDIDGVDHGTHLRKLKTGPPYPCWSPDPTDEPTMQIEACLHARSDAFIEALASSWSQEDVFEKAPSGLARIKDKVKSKMRKP